MSIEVREIMDAWYGITEEKGIVEADDFEEEEEVQWQEHLKLSWKTEEKW